MRFYFSLLYDQNGHMIIYKYKIKKECFNLFKKFENSNDFDPFRMPKPLEYQGNLPPGGQSPHEGPKSPFGFPPFFGPKHHFRPPLPMTYESFKEIRYFMILMILADNPKGITGYQLQEKFHIPRGNLLRIMDELAEMNYVSTSESVIKGRAQKFFILSEKGKKYLDQLKEKWAERFAQISEIAAPNMFGSLFIKKGLDMILSSQIDLLESKEDALDLLGGLRLAAKNFMARITDRLNHLKNAKSALDSLIQKIEKIDEPSIEEIKNLISEFKNNLEI